jgi:putative CocE/NonD family hydrolase
VDLRRPRVALGVLDDRDQRFVIGRQDVLVWQTGPLTSDVRAAGNIVATLFASTTGSEADWAVKLIDVYPDDVKEWTEMGGYQLPIALDIMRGRCYQKPAAIAPDTVMRFTVDLQQQADTFKAGHRIMVQVQSTLFPLYDRNPQTFVPNIFGAPATAYKAPPIGSRGRQRNRQTSASRFSVNVASTHGRSGCARRP